MLSISSEMLKFFSFRLSFVLYDMESTFRNQYVNRELMFSTPLKSSSGARIAQWSKAPQFAVLSYVPLQCQESSRRPGCDSRFVSVDVG